MVNDTISDMLTRIRNANLANKPTVSAPTTHINKKICGILEREGFIESFQVSNQNQNELFINLKYRSRQKFQMFPNGDRKPCITNLKRISKPGLRVYANHKDIPKILNGMGILILSTSKGLMTDREARIHGIGGELICSIW